MRPLPEWRSKVELAPWRDEDPASPLRILVAEDDREMRNLICSTLREDGFEVLEARDGRELADLVRWMSPPSPRLPPPDVVISDVRMPGPSGLDGLAMLRETTWSVPVIVITGFGDLATHDEARRLGASIVLDKPFDMDVLRTAVLALAPV